jgi:carbon-monoxide dehydrogenase large subunit
MFPPRFQTGCAGNDRPRSIVCRPQNHNKQNRKRSLPDIMDRKPRAEGGPYIGRPMPRFEDLRLVRGAGKYSDDISMEGQVYAAFVRTPHAHAKIKAIDTTAAKTMPGVIAVLTGADYVADGLKGALQRANPAGAIDIKVRAFDPAKRPVLEEPQYPLAPDRVRYPGEAVAMVVARSRLTARDAAEAVAVEYDVLPAVAVPLP